MAGFGGCYGAWGFFVVVVVLSLECPLICVFLRDALHFLNALHFYRSSLPESSQFITVCEELESM